EIGTSWDLPTLLGEAPKAGLDAQLDIDGFSERGVAVGSTFRMSGAMGTGGLVLYGLYDTGGTDRLSTGARVETDAGFRGIVDGDWRTALSPTLTLQTQLAYISDETFVSAWREYAFNERREYETSVALNDTSANGSLELVLKHDLNDFISNSYLLASRGYTVDRLPDLSYHRYGDEPMSGLTWTQQWSAAALALRPTTGTPASLGVPVGAWGGAVALDGSLSDAYEAAGYGDGTIGRLDTRHEISIPMTNGSFSFAPFVVGQATGYIGDELATYTADFDQLRLQGGGGVRASVRFARVDDSVQSRLLDLNRLRHIIEPYATAWAGWDSAEAGSIPVYDQSIEGSSEGLAVNVGVRQTLLDRQSPPVPATSIGDGLVAVTLGATPEERVWLMSRRGGTSPLNLPSPDQPRQKGVRVIEELARGRLVLPAAAGDPATLLLDDLLLRGGPTVLRGWVDRRNSAGSILATPAWRETPLLTDPLPSSPFLVRHYFREEQEREQLQAILEQLVNGTNPLERKASTGATPPPLPWAVRGTALLPDGLLVETHSSFGAFPLIAEMGKTLSEAVSTGPAGGPSRP
ncbi:MAG: hypothetical protein ACO394_11340, partial [Blastocatellia bacterium]